MKKNKILIIILCIAIVLAISLVVLKNIHKDNGKQTNTLKIDDIEVSNIVFKSIEVTISESNSEFNLIVRNNNDYPVKLNNYIVKLYNADNILINVFSHNNSTILEKEKECYMGFSLDIKYDNNYKIKIELPELEKIDGEVNEE